MIATQEGLCRLQSLIAAHLEQRFLNVWSWNMKGGKILQELPQQLTS